MSKWFRMTPEVGNAFSDDRVDEDTRHVLRQTLLLIPRAPGMSDDDHISAVLDLIKCGFLDVQTKYTRKGLFVRHRLTTPRAAA